MSLLKVALLQISPCGDLSLNLIKGIDSCKKAKELGADIALFPEMWSNGYDIYDRTAEVWKKEALLRDSDYIKTFQKLSEELEMAICVTYLERHDSGCRNSLVLFDRYGNRVLDYAKVHTCDFSVERHLMPGDDFYVTDLNTAVGNIRIGAMICYDREFPESARILMLKGAEIILVPNACPMEINRLSQLRGRAYENMLGIATCNYPCNVPDCNGHSSAFDGVVYLPELEGSRDTCILDAGEYEDVFIAEFDIEMIREYRKNEVHGNAFRRPDKYGILLSSDIKEPFIREEYRYNF